MFTVAIFAVLNLTLMQSAIGAASGQHLSKIHVSDREAKNLRYIQPGLQFMCEAKSYSPVSKTWVDAPRVTVNKDKNGTILISEEFRGETYVAHYKLTKAHNIYISTDLISGGFGFLNMLTQVITFSDDKTGHHILGKVKLYSCSPLVMSSM